MTYDINLAWLGLAWLGLAWLGLAWLGLAWLGLCLLHLRLCLLGLLLLSLDLFDDCLQSIVRYKLIFLIESKHTYFHIFRPRIDYLQQRAYGQAHAFVLREGRSPPRARRRKKEKKYIIR